VAHSCVVATARQPSPPVPAQFVGGAAGRGSTELVHADRRTQTPRMPRVLGEPALKFRSSAGGETGVAPRKPLRRHGVPARLPLESLGSGGARTWGQGFDEFNVASIDAAMAQKLRAPIDHALTWNCTVCSEMPSRAAISFWNTLDSARMKNLTARAQQHSMPSASSKISRGV